ncbi:A-factor biosynthesis hotdog domain [Paraburkholderia caribensis MBA4]|uniref:A-factor biosynthesis hotdog domain n=1 Tax=Paraburkholderia caribensis MBA4 TaxID=1323664 RepID=A0A0P0R508_9BURK|nr:AfsA-related hotdog domain-containing protein [Paraburkholderia caribensis]ALL63124.1 A-factor biosynthesis hotdog domain [Paraburkholderia caribensis MBA4]
MKIVYVVNNRFVQFAEKHDAVFTVSSFIEMVSKEPLAARLNVMPGQGVDAAELSALVTRYAETPAMIEVSVSAKRPKATFFDAHKHKSRNIVVSLAEKVADQEFVMDLHFDGDNEFFDDHMSGQHIQGMGITEAARQAFLAVTEQFFLPRKTRHYFVIHRMETEFKAFVFPIDAYARYFVLSDKRRGKGNVSIDARIEIWQAESLCAICHVSFTAFEVSWINGREHAAATDVLAARTEQLTQAQLVA